MTYEEVKKQYDLCVSYTRKLNHNQIGALYEFLLIFNKECDHLSKKSGLVAIFREFVFILEQVHKDEDSLHNHFIDQKFTEIWMFMLGMLMVQDEYNRFNKNYKSKIK